jgi:hypothetical protein
LLKITNLGNKDLCDKDLCYSHGKGNDKYFMK